jgi:hypothetical protein
MKYSPLSNIENSTSDSHDIELASSTEINNPLSFDLDYNSKYNINICKDIDAAIINTVKNYSSISISPKDILDKIFAIQVKFLSKFFI